MFGLSMKHTGLALILAGAVLADQPLAILMIVLATLMQHLLAGLVQWWSAMDRRRLSLRPESDAESLDAARLSVTVTSAPARSPASAMSRSCSSGRRSITGLHRAPIRLVRP